MSRSLRAVLVVLFVLGAALPAAAETTEILATGPIQGKGIPYLSPNVIRYFLVTYRAATSDRTSDTPSAIRVFYTDTAIVPYSSWKSVSCGQHRLLSVSAQPQVLYYGDRQGWSLFIAYGPGYSKACSFADAFIARFGYFLGITGDAALSSFPAILKVP